MQNFIFFNPTKIIFGKGTIEKLGKEVKKFGGNALFIYGGGSIKKNGIYNQIISSLSKEKIMFQEFSGVKSNPIISHVKEGIKIAKKKKIDVIIAVGGGSVIDEAKTIAVGAIDNIINNDIWDFFIKKRKITSALPILTVVTLSASASEMNNGAIITNELTKQKLSINSPFIQPKVSILDPQTLYSLSNQLTAYGSVDIISHLLEAYFNNSEDEDCLQNKFIKLIIKIVLDNTQKILLNSYDYKIRSNLMWAATLAFNGFTTAGLGSISYPIHMIEHSLSAIYDIHHGAGLSIIIPGWMEYMLEKNPIRFAEFAKLFYKFNSTKSTLQQAIAGVKYLRSWFYKIGCPISLKEVNIDSKDFNFIANNVMETALLWNMKYYTKEIIYEILKKCYFDVDKLDLKFKKR